MTSCYGNSPAGNYTLNLHYGYRGYSVKLPLGQYAESAIFQVTRTPLVVSAPLVINEGKDVEQGSSGTVQLAVKSGIKYPNSYFYIEGIPGVLTSQRVEVETLPYNETYVLSLPYTVENEAVIGGYTLRIIHKHPGTQQDVELALDEHASSANFNIVVGTGIEGNTLAGIYAYQVADGFVLKGLSGNENISVYNTSGRLLLATQAVANELLISTAQADAKHCIVVIKQGSRQAVLKVALK